MLQKSCHSTISTSNFNNWQLFFLFYSDFVTRNLLRKTGYCMYFSMSGLHDDDCGKRYLCICEKGMDKIPAPLCSVKETSHSAVWIERWAAKGRSLLKFGITADTVFPLGTWSSLHVENGHPLFQDPNDFPHIVSWMTHRTTWRTQYIMHTSYLL